MPFAPLLSTIKKSMLKDLQSAGGARSFVGPKKPL
jgi:hypothetical protein